MGKLIDITGKKFERLTCIEMAGRSNGHVMWKFKCDCGNFITTRGSDVRQGKTTSCGCYRDEEVSRHAKGISPKDRKKKKREVK